MLNPFWAHNFALYEEESMVTLDQPSLVLVFCILLLSGDLEFVTADLNPHHYNNLKRDRGNFFVIFWMFLDMFAECNVSDDAFELVY